MLLSQGRCPRLISVAVIESLDTEQLGGKATLFQLTVPGSSLPWQAAKDEGT